MHQTRGRIRDLVVSEIQVAVDGQVRVVVGQAAHDLGDVAPVRPEQVAGHGVDGLQGGPSGSACRGRRRRPRGPLQGALGQGSGPHQPQIADVVAVHLVERAVAPAVLRAGPHEPVARQRILAHGGGCLRPSLVGSRCSGTLSDGCRGSRGDFGVAAPWRVSISNSGRFRNRTSTRPGRLSAGWA